jgi:hypothetical protein
MHENSPRNPVKRLCIDRLGPPRFAWGPQGPRVAYGCDATRPLLGAFVLLGLTGGLGKGRVHLMGVSMRLRFDRYQVKSERGADIAFL